MNNLTVETGDNTGGGYGGGIDTFGTLTLTNSNVSGNTAAYFGGGILSYGPLTLTNSTVSGNTALVGAAASTTPAPRPSPTAPVEARDSHRSGWGCDRILGLLRELLPSPQFRSGQYKLCLVRFDPDCCRDRGDRTCHSGWAEAVHLGPTALVNGHRARQFRVSLAASHVIFEDLQCGYGLFMISIGSGALTLASLALVACGFEKPAETDQESSWLRNCW